MNTHKNRVFISAAEILVPPAQDLSSFLNQVVGGVVATADSHQDVSNLISLEALDLKLDSTDKHHPSVKDVKSMRTDVIAMCICMSKMLLKYGEANWSEVPLFVSTGASSTGLTEEIDKIYSLLRELISASESKRNQQVSRDIHPLFALKALTNSAQAYAAQLFGFRGQNTTFGSTSNGSFHAFTEAVDAIQFGEAQRAVVGASNGGGLYSQLMSLGLAPEGRSFRESAVAVTMILESEKSLVLRKAKSSCEIFEVRASTLLPQLSEPISSNRYSEFSSDVNFSAEAHAIFSGGACLENFLSESKSVGEHWTKHSSPYSALGSSGCASFLLNLALGFQMLEEKLSTKVDCLDSDTYFRESFIQLGSPWVSVKP